ACVGWLVARPRPAVVAPRPVVDRLAPAAIVVHHLPSRWMAKLESARAPHQVHEAAIPPTRYLARRAPAPCRAPRAPDRAESKSQAAVAVTGLQVERGAPGRP